MDTLTAPTLDFCEAIEDTFRYYDNPIRGMKATLIFNREEGQFVMLHHSYYHAKYENLVVAHLWLQGDQILVHDDNAGMNYIAPNLIRQGVPRDKITVGAHPDWFIESA